MFIILVFYVRQILLLHTVFSSNWLQHTAIHLIGPVPLQNWDPLLAHTASNIILNLVLRERERTGNRRFCLGQFYRPGEATSPASASVSTRQSPPSPRRNPRSGMEGSSQSAAGSGSSSLALMREQTDSYPLVHVP